LSGNAAGHHHRRLRISSFSDGTSAALDTALAAIKAQGATAIVLDLRDNPGGLLMKPKEWPAVF